MIRQLEAIKRLHRSLDIPKDYYLAANILEKDGRTVIKPIEPRPISIEERDEALGVLVAVGIIRTASIDSILARMVSRIEAKMKSHDRATAQRRKKYATPKFKAPKSRKPHSAPSRDKATAAILANPGMRICDLSRLSGVSERTVKEAQLRLSLKQEGNSA